MTNQQQPRTPEAQPGQQQPDQGGQRHQGQPQNPDRKQPNEEEE